MRLRDEVVRLARFLLAAVDALVDEACAALEREAASLERETARRRLERGGMMGLKEEMAFCIFETWRTVDEDKDNAAADSVLSLLRTKGEREWRCQATAEGILGVKAWCRHGRRARKGHEGCRYRWVLDLEDQS